MSNKPTIAELEQILADGGDVDIAPNGDVREPRDRMLKWFAFNHLPQNLQQTSEPFHTLAIWITTTVAPGPERTVAMRKLLEAKDAAVRATVLAGG